MSSSESTGQGEQEPLAFEECIRQLAQIVERLERGDLPLEQSVSLFERGMHLARTSQAQLERAEKRVEELLAVADDGTPVTREIDPR